MSKPLQADDPMELHTTELTGDRDLMLDCIIEEYATMGWSEENILLIFDRPFFQATYNLARSMDPDTLRRRVRSVIARCGVVRVEVRDAKAEQSRCAEAASHHDCHSSSSGRGERDER